MALDFNVTPVERPGPLEWDCLSCTSLDHVRDVTEFDPPGSPSYTPDLIAEYVEWVQTQNRRRMLSASDYIFARRCLTHDRREFSYWNRKHSQQVMKRNRCSRLFYLHSFELKENILYRKTENAAYPLLKVVTPEMVVPVVMKIHIEKGHLRADRLFPHVRRTAYGIIREDCDWVAKRCPICHGTTPPVEPVRNDATPSVEPVRNDATPPPQPIRNDTTSRIEPICNDTIPVSQVSTPMERIELVIIDFSRRASNGYKYILHVKDHFSKLSILRPLKSKCATQIAHYLKEIVEWYGPPQIIQCDNSPEFKGAMLLLCQKHDIYFARSTPQQTHANGFMERGGRRALRIIKAWMRHTKRKDWENSLLYAQNAINTAAGHGLARNSTPFTGFFSCFRHRGLEEFLPRSSRFIPMSPEAMALTELDIQQYVMNSHPDRDRVASIVDRFFFNALPHVESLDSSTHEEQGIDELPSLNDEKSQPSSDEEPQISSPSHAATNNHDELETGDHPETCVPSDHHCLPLRSTNGGTRRPREDDSNQTRILDRHTKKRDQLKTNSEQVHDSRPPHIFKVGEYCMLHIPRVDGTNSPDWRVFARVIHISYKNGAHHRVQTPFGILNRNVQTCDMNYIEDLVPDAMSELHDAPSSPVTTHRIGQLMSMSMGNLRGVKSKRKRSRRNH